MGDRIWRGEWVLFRQFEWHYVNINAIIDSWNEGIIKKSLLDIGVYIPLQIHQ